MSVAESASGRTGKRVIEDDARVAAVEIALSSVFPFVLKAVIQVGVLDLLKEQGPNASLSAREIVDLLPAINNERVECLERHLRYLASFDILTESLAERKAGAEDRRAQALERKYGLKPVCEYLVQTPGTLSMVPLFQLNTLTECLQSMQVFDKALTDCISPFTEANGMSLYEKTIIDPHYGSLFQKAMTNTSQMLFAHLLEHYDGFEELEGKTLVDVGRGLGTSLSMVVAKWPKIQAINFDLPEVAASAPSISGVKQEGGNFFVSVPSGDAIMMKFTLHNWSDEDCLKILKNSYEALPVSGKIIVMEAVVPLSPSDNTKSTRGSLAFDMYMIVYTKGGKERTEDEFRDLLEAAGFRNVQRVLQVNALSVIEAEKT